MKPLTVKQLADLSGVSVRTLHHYDRIGLLKPQQRTESRYRLYGGNEALRLQQILLYREMQLELSVIRDILDDPEFDTLTALQEHKKRLRQKQRQIGAIIRSVDHSIFSLRSNRKNMDYHTLYEGFTDPETAEAYTLEAIERWGKASIEASHQKLLSLTKKDRDLLSQFGEELHAQLAASVMLPPSAPEVQQLIALHFDYIGKHFDLTRTIYRNLGEMYAADPRFRNYYIRFDERLPDFLRKAIAFFCN